MTRCAAPKAALRREGMGEYRVYRVGEDEHVRVAKAAGPAAAPALGPAPRRQVYRTESRGTPRWLWLLIAAGLAAAAVLYWLYGREAVGNSQAALDMAKLSGQVPDWAVIAAPAVVVAVVALVTVYLAFGRHLALKLILVVVVVAALAAPGLAVGYANGTVDVVGGQTDQEKTDVENAEDVLVKDGRDLPNKPMNILLIGSDKSDIPGDPGRSDTQLLVRLDPETKSISMLSVPRDLYAYIDGVGYTKINEGYSYGRARGAIKAFTELTGLPINHFVEVNFDGFWQIIDILGGVYFPVDHTYFVPASADYKSINLPAGYQLVKSKQALNFVRYRHDQEGDFTRMQRQQFFLKELQRQSGRWSGDWGKVIKLIRAITKETTSDINSLKKLQPLVALAFEVNTSKVYQAHIEGATPMIGGVSYVQATDAEVAQAVQEFTHPTQPPIKTSTKVPKKSFAVTVYNGSGVDGYATLVAGQLGSLGYKATASTDAPEFPGKTSVVYAPRGLKAHAEAIAEMLWPSRVELVNRAPGVVDGIEVFVTSSFDGTIDIPEEAQGIQQTLEKNVKYDWSTLQAEDRQTPLKLEAPTSWSSGFTYNEIRRYKVETTEGKHVAAAVAVVSTPQSGYWSIQAMRWMNPPAIDNPTSTEVVKGTKYMLFYQGSHLHMVAWKEHGTLYWVLNTLDDELSNDLMMGLATSCKPVR